MVVIESVSHNSKYSVIYLTFHSCMLVWAGTIVAEASQNKMEKQTKIDKGENIKSLSSVSLSCLLFRLVKSGENEHILPSLQYHHPTVSAQGV